MYIKSLKINNYKSFWESDEIPFEKGFNLIVGQNDSGKSALLESLLPGVLSKPHRSLLTAPEIHISHSLQSTTKKRINLTNKDIRAYLCGQQHLIVRGASGYPHLAEKRFNDLLAAQGGIFEAIWHDREFNQGHFIDFPDTGIDTSFLYPNVGWPRDVVLGTLQTEGNFGPFSTHIANGIKQEIYGFGAERYRTGSCQANGNRTLLPDASNLPEVLNKLNEDPATERELLDHVMTIFPHIKHVSAALEGNNIAHVRIWTHEVSTRRRDLAVALADSGSGIGQVLAMLYVVVTADRPKTILIDEPQSFLHPGAVRKLFEIFSTYSQHQYIVTTHAPMGLAITGATNMLLVRRGSEQSTVTRLDPSTQEGVSVFLSEVGARLSDVYGADNILWVEGKTEERCFPILLKEVAHRMIRGTQILGVVNTGDFESEHADRVVAIYQKLSSTTSVLPSALAFVFDSEGRSETERDDITRRAKELVKWLPRRMYENYLIDCAAICTVINQEDSEREVELSANDVGSWLKDHGAEAKFFPKSPATSTYGSAEWDRDVHASKILQTLFSELTEQRVRYDKVKHGEKLTRLLSANPTPALKDLANFLGSLLPKD